MRECRLSLSLSPPSSFPLFLSLSLSFFLIEKSKTNTLMFIELKLETGVLLFPITGFARVCACMCACEYIHADAYVETATHSIINRIGRTVCCVSDRISSISFGRQRSGCFFFRGKKKIWCYIRSLARLLISIDLPVGFVKLGLFGRKFESKISLSSRQL